MRIHTRLAWMSFAVAFIALGGVTLAGNAFLKQERWRQLDDSLLDHARILSVLAPTEELPGSVRMVGLVQAIHQETGSRLTLIREDGVVLADSDVPVGRLHKVENHRDRPEVQEALRTGVGRDTRVSATVAREMAYVAVRWGPAEAPFGVARASKPMVLVRAEQRRGQGYFLLAVLASLAFSGAVGYFAAIRLSRPLARVSAAAREIASGRLERRVEVEGGADVHDLATAINALTDSLRGQIAAAHAERLRLTEVLESIPDAIFALDAEGKIAYVNASAERLFQLPRDRFLGRTPVEAVRDPDLQKAVDGAVRKRKAVTSELRLMQPEPRTVVVNAVPLQSGGIVVLQDVTGLRRLQMARREMVANIGHELRTPLSAVIGYLETLEQSPDLDPDEKARFLAIIGRNARRLERLVQDLSRLARLESPQLAVERHPHSLAILIERARETMAPKAAAVGVQVKVDVPAELPEVSVDRHAIETVLLNLLDNALRVSPMGSTIALSARSQDRRIFVSVADQGPGVPKEYRDRVFERFFRMDPGRTREEGGAGLGLAIVKHAILLHGGEVWVEEATGGGAAFCFTLPEGPSEGKEA